MKVPAWTTPDAVPAYLETQADVQQALEEAHRMPYADVYAKMNFARNEDVRIDLPEDTPEPTTYDVHALGQVGPVATDTYAPGDVIQFEGAYYEVIGTPRAGAVNVRKIVYQPISKQINRFEPPITLLLFEMGPGDIQRTGLQITTENGVRFLGRKTTTWTPLTLLGLGAVMFLAWRAM